MYPCYGTCTNTDGSYSCVCPAGTQSNDPRNLLCAPIPSSNHLQVKVVIGTFSMPKQQPLSVVIFPIVILAKENTDIKVNLHQYKYA